MGSSHGQAVGCIASCINRPPADGRTPNTQWHNHVLRSMQCRMIGRKSLCNEFCTTTPLVGMTEKATCSAGPNQAVDLLPDVAPDATDTNPVLQWWRLLLLILREVQAVLSCSTAHVTPVAVDRTHANHLMTHRRKTACGPCNRALRAHPAPTPIKASLQKPFNTHKVKTAHVQLATSRGCRQTDRQCPAGW